MGLFKEKDKQATNDAAIVASLEQSVASSSSEEKLKKENERLRAWLRLIQGSTDYENGYYALHGYMAPTEHFIESKRKYVEGAHPSQIDEGVADVYSIDKLRVILRFNSVDGMSQLLRGVQLGQDSLSGEPISIRLAADPSERGAYFLEVLSNPIAQVSTDPQDEQQRMQTAQVNAIRQKVQEKLVEAIHSLATTIWGVQNDMSEERIAERLLYVQIGLRRLLAAVCEEQQLTVQQAIEVDQQMRERVSKILAQTLQLDPQTAQFAVALSRGCSCGWDSDGERMRLSEKLSSCPVHSFADDSD